MLRHTKRITLELSNICNLAKTHTKCPLHLETETRILPDNIVLKVLQFASSQKFAGRIAFHNYNEPLIDRRIEYFISTARFLCPQADIYICTNGTELDQEYLDKLVRLGVTNMHISAYRKVDYERFLKLKTPAFIPDVELMILDDTLEAYTRPYTHSSAPCFAPLSELIISRDASVLLCCLDWQRKYIFGNAASQSLEEVLHSTEILETYTRLSKGDRFLDICKRCNWTR